MSKNIDILQACVIVSYINTKFTKKTCLKIFNQNPGYLWEQFIQSKNILDIYPLLTEENHAKFVNWANSILEPKIIQEFIEKKTIPKHTVIKHSFVNPRAKDRLQDSKIFREIFHKDFAKVLAFDKNK